MIEINPNVKVKVIKDSKFKHIDVSFKFIKNFKKDMESKFLKKYIEINKNQSRNSLTIVYKNFINNLWNKIISFFQSKIIKN